MSVLDAFIHDPLVEWEDEKCKLVCHGIDEGTTATQEREPRRNMVKASVDDLRSLGKNALNQIERKFKGLYTASSKERHGGGEKDISTGNSVQMLMREATDLANSMRKIGPY